MQVLAHSLGTDFVIAPKPVNPLLTATVKAGTTFTPPPVFVNPLAPKPPATSSQNSQTTQTVNTSDTVVPGTDVPGTDVSNPVQFGPLTPPFVPPAAVPTASFWQSPMFWVAIGGAVVVGGTGIYFIRRRRKS